MLLGGYWDAIYVSPMNGFVYTRSTSLLNSLIVVMAGTGGVVFWGVLFYLFRNRINNTIIRLILLGFTFFAATEPILYFGMGAIMFLGGQTENLGDPGDLIDAGVSPYIIIAICAVILIILLPKFYRTLYINLKPFFEMNYNNLKTIFFIIFIPFYLLRAIITNLMANNFDVITILIYAVYGIFYTAIGIYIILRDENKKIKQGVKLENIDDSNAIPSENIIHEKPEQNNNITLEMERPIYSRSINLISKRNFLALGLITLCVTSLWLGVFGFTENTSIGLNWNEDPYLSNINIQFQSDSKLNINYSFLPDFPVILGKNVCSWKNYEDLSLNFSDILIGTPLNIEDFSKSIDISSNFWGLDEYRKNSRTVALKNSISFNIFQNITVIGNHITYNITDPWQYYEPLSFIDQIDIRYPSQYMVDSIKFYKKNGSLSITPFLNVTGHIVIQNPTLAVAPLIIQLELIKLS